MPLPSSLRFRTFLTLAGLLWATVTLPAQQAERDYSPSDSTGDLLGTKYKVAVEEKNFDLAIALLDAQMAAVPADSYDVALIYQLKTNIYLQKGEYAKAVEPMEKGLALSDTKNPSYYQPRATRELLLLLAQLYFQEAYQSKDPAFAASYYDKSDKVMTRWLSLTPNPAADMYLLHAQILYTRATQDSANIDIPLIKRTLEQVEKGLHLSIHPKDTFYVLKQACLQQLNRNEELAEVLELMVQEKPDSPTYWLQLAGLYLNAENSLRAALTLERAQANGHLQGPEYNFNIVSIYFNMEAYEKSAQLFETGLKSGALENNPKNWELLAFCYQQLHRPLQSIDALKRASASFPTMGQFEYMIAQGYQAMDKAADALPHLQAAIAKGNLTKPHQTYMFLAYVAFELKKFDIALEAAQKAAALPEGAEDPQTKTMLKSIEETIKDREAKKSNL